jgi:hypothetical protein
MTGEKRMFTFFRRTTHQVIASHLEIIAKAKFLDMVKLLSQPNTLFLKFFLLNLWTITCYLFHNFVR